MTSRDQKKIDERRCVDGNLCISFLVWRHLQVVCRSRRPPRLWRFRHARRSARRFQSRHQASCVCGRSDAANFRSCRFLSEGGGGGVIMPLPNKANDKHYILKEHSFLFQKLALCVGDSPRRH